MKLNAMILNAIYPKYANYMNEIYFSRINTISNNYNINKLGQLL